MKDLLKEDQELLSNTDLSANSLVNDCIVLLNNVFNDVGNHNPPNNLQYIKNKIEILSNHYLSSDVIPMKSSSDYENKENINTTTYFEAIEDESNYLKKKLAEIEINTILAKSNAELTEAKSCIDRINADLEEQMTECFELHDKLHKLSDSEKNHQHSLFTLASESGMAVTSTDCITRLIEVFKEHLHQHDDDSHITDTKYEANSMNDSILDLDMFQTETICLKDFSGEIDSLNKVCYNVTGAILSGLVRFR